MAKVSNSASKPDLTDEELADRLLERLKRRGPDCLSQLAVELITSNRRVEAVLVQLEKDGWVRRFPHRDRSIEYRADEAQWGINTDLRTPRTRRRF